LALYVLETCQSERGPRVSLFEGEPLVVLKRGPHALAKFASEHGPRVWY